MDVFEVIDSEGKICGKSFMECHEAAQEAEFMMTETGKTHRVIRVEDQVVMYETYSELN